MKKIAILASAALLFAGPAFGWAAWGPVYTDAQIPVPIWGDETTDLEACAGTSEYTGTSKRAYVTWNQVSNTKFAWTVGGWDGPFGGAGDNYNTIRFKEISDNGVLGFTVLSFYEGLRDCDIKIDVNQNWQCGPANANWRQMDMESVILHEIGHQLGLDHSSNSSAVMWWAIGMGENQRSLHSDDIAGIRALYPQ
jgi:hypothetical protein